MVAVNAPSGLAVVLRTGAALAAAMGVGRFAFTPIIPLMEAQDGLSPQHANLLATSNYIGYLVGAVLGMFVPVISRSRLALRTSALVLILTLIAMPLTSNLAVFTAARGVAGVASAVIFMVASNTILSTLAASRPHMVGWAYGGVGAGIALSGVVVALLSHVAGWQWAWWVSAALAAVLSAFAWKVGQVGGARVATPADDGGHAAHRGWFGILAGSYFLEGAGYIIAGTFLVAAVSATGPAWLSGSVWIIVGLAAIPSCAVFTFLSTKYSRPSLLTVGLILQAFGIALPALSGSAAAAIIASVIFGGTFIGITTLSLATGRHLGVPGAVAILTAGYSVGQVVGPLVAGPLLASGYRPVLLAGAVIVLLAAIGAGLLRIRFPHGDQPHHGARRPASTR